jgi:hypothetical protein
VYRTETSAGTAVHNCGVSDPGRRAADHSTTARPDRPRAVADQRLKPAPPRPADRRLTPQAGHPRRRLASSPVPKRIPAATACRAKAATISAAYGLPRRRPPGTSPSHSAAPAPRWRGPCRRPRSSGRLVSRDDAVHPRLLGLLRQLRVRPRPYRRPPARPKRRDHLRPRHAHRPAQPARLGAFERTPSGASSASAVTMRLAFVAAIPHAGRHFSGTSAHGHRLCVEKAQGVSAEAVTARYGMYLSGMRWG